jgi:hypothetical protein
MSSEKRFEHIEYKIKEAAENNPIVFEEKSWIKMEAILDREDKRKPFVWLWFLFPIVLMGGYGLYLFSETTNKATQNLIVQKDFQKDTPSTPALTKQSFDKTLLKSAIDKISFVSQKNKTVATEVNNNVPNTVQNNFDIYTSKNQIKKNQWAQYANNKKNSKTKIISKEFITNKALKEKVIRSKNSTLFSSKTTASIKKIEATEDDAMVESTKSSAIDQVNKNENQTTSKIEKIVTSSKNDKTLSKNKKESNTLSRFYVFANAGADIGSVKLLSLKNNLTVAKYGFAIGYDVNRKINIQAGFFVSKKKYTAGPNDYSIKAGTYLSQATITKIDAACLVYELPITLQYNFLQKKSFNLYAGVGVASYIMKTEDYTYFYKRYNMNLSRAYSYTGNQHLFSTALVSAGIQKNISKKFALQLEPTISIPLKGVGDGSVKLFSTSMLLGIKYHPFKKQ